MFSCVRYWYAQVFLKKDWRFPSEQPGKAGNVAQRKESAIAYLRTTASAANVGADKDSDTRQRDAIAAFAKKAAPRARAQA